MDAKNQDQFDCRFQIYRNTMVMRKLDGSQLHSYGKFTGLGRVVDQIRWNAWLAIFIYCLHTL